MSPRSLPLPGHATVVAYAALVVALGGSAASAAGLINGGSIKPHTVPGTALRNHTLSEAQLSLSGLPDIPNPSTPYAANYIHNTGLIRLAGGQSRLLFNHAPWQVTATCVNVSPGVWDAQTSLRNTGAVPAQVATEYSSYGQSATSMLGAGATTRVAYDEVQNKAGSSYVFNGGYNDFDVATLGGHAFLHANALIGANALGADCLWDVTFSN